MGHAVRSVLTPPLTERGAHLDRSARRVPMGGIRPGTTSAAQPARPRSGLMSTGSTTPPRRAGERTRRARRRCRARSSPMSVPTSLASASTASPKAGSNRRPAATISPVVMVWSGKGLALSQRFSMTRSLPSRRRPAHLPWTPPGVDHLRIPRRAGS
jgi:hypothetical protein